jgi:hypothetical protein
MFSRGALKGKELDGLNGLSLYSSSSIFSCSYGDK